MSAEIKLIPPKNWQPDPDNNPHSMGWNQNSTKSRFTIVQGDEKLPIPLADFAPQLAQSAGPLLESTDELSLGHGNYGYRYFLNLSASEVSDRLSGSTLEGLIADMISDTNNLPFKGMLIWTEKQGDFYTITLLSPRNNFDSVMKEMRPTLDSIQLSNSTEN